MIMIRSYVGHLSSKDARLTPQARLPPFQLSVHQPLSGESGNQTANLPVIGQPTLTTEPRYS